MPAVLKKNVKFQTQKETIEQEFKFDGGLVTDVHESKLENNQTPNVENIIYTSTGTIKSKKGYTRYNNDPVGASSDEANTGSSTGTLTIDSYQDYVAQTFQVGTGAAMVQVDFYLEMDTAGETQLMRAELWSGDTGPDAVLYSAQILQVSGASETEYSFRFRVPYTLSASTEYAIVLKPYNQGSSTDVNTVLVHHTGDDYASGGAYTSANSGITWAAVSSTDLKFNVYTGGATGGTGLIRYYGPAGLQQTLAKYGDTMYRGDDGTGAMTAITMASGVDLETDGYLDWVIANNTLLICDGTNYIKKYRGSTNSNYSTGTISVTNGSTTVTGSGTSWGTSTNAESNEYIKLPDGKWYLITNVGGDTSLTIETGYSGNNASGQTYVISPWGEIQGNLNSSTAPASLTRPAPKYIESHVNRLWTLTDNTLNFSALDTSIDGEHFNDWDSANNAGSIIIPSSKGDTGTGLYSLSNSLYVFQNRSIWRLYGTSPANFELRNVTNEIGLIDVHSLVEWNDLLIFLSNKGIQYFDGTNLRNVSDGIINTDINSWTNKSKAQATLWNNTYVLAYTPNGSNYNSEVLFLDLTRQAYGKFTGTYVGGWSNWDGGTDNGEIYFTSSNQGTLYKWDIGGHDDGYPIVAMYDTPSLDFGGGINDKAIKKFYLQQLQLGDWNMTVTQYSDIDANIISGQDINLSSGTSSLWDTAVWDTDTWPNESSITTDRVAEFQGLAKYFKFRFKQDGYNEGMEILGMLAASRVRRLR